MGKKYYLLLVLLFTLFIIDSFSQSAICSYSYRKRITFDPSKVSGPIDLTNYPALIDITTDNDLKLTPAGHVQNASGFDIIFTADDGVTLLNFQLESYSSASGQLIVWVKIPNLSTSINTYIYMYYGNGAITADQSSTGTWDANYKGVYHLNTNYNDNTSTGNNGTNNGLTLGAGKIANGGICNSTTDYVSIGVSGWGASTATYETWVKSTSAWSATEAYFLGHTTIAAYNNRVQIYDFDGNLRVGLGNNHSIGGDITALATNTWYSVAVTYNSGNFTVYVNGVSVYTGTYSALATFGSASIGNDGNTATNNEGIASGIIDELKISNINRSSDWIATEYNNQNSPSTFYSITAEPYRWTGGTSTNWGITTNWAGSVVPPTDADIIITNGTHQPTLDMSRQIGAMWIQSGATVNLNSSAFILSLRYDITNCGTLTGNTSTVNCNSTTHTQNQYFSGSGTFNLNSLTVNNTFATLPTLILDKDVSVTGALTLTSGITYTTLTNILNLTSTASSTSGLVTSYVSGPMTKAGTTAFVFPVGKSGFWRRIAIGAPSTSTTFRAEYFRSAYVNTTSLTAPLYNVSTVEYWVLDQAVGTGNALVTLYWENAGTSGITNCPDLTVAHWNSTSWDEKPGTASGTCSGAGTGFVVTNAVVTTFSPFTFGSKLSSVNPLPIELIKFTATACNKEVCLDWSTATETNNDYFTIEKTKDGASFNAVGTVNGAGNSTSLLNYSSVDNAPYEGVSYYRLKQTDFNGAFTYSGLQMVDFNATDNFSFNVYPNPNSGDNINVAINADQGQEILVVVYDATGKESYSKVIVTENTGDTVYAIDPDHKLAAGLYMITATSQQNIFSKKIVVK